MKTRLTGIVLLDSSFRHTRDPLASPPGLNPASDVSIEVGLLKGEEPNAYAVTLRVVMDAPTSLYALSVGYAALLSVDWEGAELPPDADHRMMVIGAGIAFPYCRELISNLTSRGRFGTTFLNPTNFSHVLKQQNAEATAPSE